nr:hypothetical protein [Phycisphaerae bacterium]
YFGARYYDPWTSVWLSTDPVLNSLFGDREDHPRLARKLALYSQARQNPLVLIDPDGRDALGVVYTQYRVGTPIGEVPRLGHAGIVIIDSKTGHTRYYEYGRYDAQNLGIVKRRIIPNLEMGSDGKPTKESMQKLLSFLSKRWGQGSKIEGAYVQNDNFEEMIEYAESRRLQNTDENRESYNELSNNCATFCMDVLEAGDAETPLSILDWPNEDIEDLQDIYPSVRFDPETDEVGGLLYEQPQGIEEHIRQWIKDLRSGAGEDD